MMQTDALFWAYNKGLSVRDGVRFSLEGVPYLADMVNCDKRVMHCKKGTQIGLTTLKFLESVHACYYRKYDQNVIYMMPTVKTVEKLAKVSFDPIFDCNPWLKKKLNSNNATQKEINGRSIIFVGAQPQKVAGHTKDSANLRSIPADCVKRDEIDLMDEDMVEMSKQRLNRSRFRIEENFGSPTYPGWGIDKLYEQSDQRKWQIKCQHCGKYTCLVQDFPDSILMIGGEWKRACKHCHKEIYVIHGKWKADFPDAREAGFWTDGLMSPFADLEEYMYRYHNTDGAKHSEFLRSILGIAATEAECQLSERDVLDITSSDPIQMYSSGETIMGCDVGSYLHYVIGIKTGNDTYELLRIGKAEDFDELHDVAKKMNVKYCVIDAMPETHKIKEFARQEPYAVSRAFCSEHYNSRPTWDSKQGTVKANRNEFMDNVNEIVITKKLKLPRQCEYVTQYADSLTRTVKTIVEHPETGVRKPKWLKLSGGEGDHYYLSTLYFLLAASRSSISRKGSGPNVRPTKQRTNYSIGR